VRAARAAWDRSCRGVDSRIVAALVRPHARQGGLSGRSADSHGERVIFAPYPEGALEVAESVAGDVLRATLSAIPRGARLGRPAFHEGMMPATKSSTAAPESLIGQTIGGQYTIQRFLGQGSKSQVFLASHRTLHRNIVVHLLNVPWADDANAWAKFEEQARTLRSFEHTNIAALIDFGRDAGRIFVVTELVEGHLLSDYVHQAGRITLEVFVPIAAQILKGLGATHARGLVHRDLKPSNVVLVEEQGRVNVKILDLGLAQVLEGPPRDEEPPIVGTPAYLAPEQIMNKPVDSRTDVYALGATFYFLLSGRLPFEGDSAAAVLYKHINDKPTPLTSVLPSDHHLPDGLIEMVHDCLAKNPDNRPNDANEVVERMIDSVPAAMFRLPIAAVPVTARAATGPHRATTSISGPVRVATRAETGPTRAPTGDYRLATPTPPPPIPARLDTNSAALAAAQEASGPRPIVPLDSTSAPTMPLPDNRGGGGGWILGVLAVLLTAGLVYVYIQSQSAGIVLPPNKIADPGKTVQDTLANSLAAARKFDEDGKLQEALGAYEAVLAVDPNNATAKSRAAALTAQIASKTTPPDTKVDAVPDTKVVPPDTKIDPPDTKVDPPDTKIDPPDTKVDPKPPVEFSIDAVGPKKAEVFIDDVSRGKTPLKLDLSPGSHKFEIRAPGWNSHLETIEVAADGQKSLKPKLLRKVGGTSSSGGSINRDEENAASADLEPDKGVETKFEVKGG
jgi:serine/threonine protein kinase